MFTKLDLSDLIDTEEQWTKNIQLPLLPPRTHTHTHTHSQSIHGQLFSFSIYLLWVNRGVKCYKIENQTFLLFLIKSWTLENFE